MCCLEKCSGGGGLLAGGFYGEIAEIAVVAEKMPLITPCGGCRQRLKEFSTAETLVHLCDANGIVESVTLGDLIPKAFQLD